MTTYPLGLPDELLDAVKRTAEETELSQADVMRQAIKFGLDQVRTRLSKEKDFAAVSPSAKLNLVKKGGRLMLSEKLDRNEILAAIRADRQGK